MFCFFVNNMFRIYVLENEWINFEDTYIGKVIMPLKKIWELTANSKMVVSGMIFIWELIPLKIKIVVFFNIFNHTSVSDRVVSSLVRTPSIVISWQRDFIGVNFIIVKIVKKHICSKKRYCSVSLALAISNLNIWSNISLRSRIRN